MCMKIPKSAFASYVNLFFISFNNKIFFATRCYRIVFVRGSQEVKNNSFVDLLVHDAWNKISSAEDGKKSK